MKRLPTPLSALLMVPLCSYKNEIEKQKRYITDGRTQYNKESEDLLPSFKPLRMTCFITLTSHAVARAFKYVDRLVVTWFSTYVIESPPGPIRDRASLASRYSNTMEFNVKKLASGAGLFFTRAVQVNNVGENAHIKCKPAGSFREPAVTDARSGSISDFCLTSATRHDSIGNNNIELSAIK